MNALVLDDEQQLLRKAARDFVDAHAPLSGRVARRTEPVERAGFDSALWAKLAAQGWVGITVPEAYGGAGGRLADLAVVLEELGRTLTPTPYLSTELLASMLLVSDADPSRRDRLLQGIVAGERILAVGLQDGAHHDLDPTTVAEHTDGRWSLTGTKRLVVDGPAAEAIIITARLGGTDDVGLFLVTPDGPGVDVAPRRLVDDGVAADVHLDRADAEAIATPADRGALALAVDAATVGLCAEMLGGAQAIFDTTVQYLKDRIQFDVPIGSFQALQHRAALLHCDLVLARSLVRDAIGAVDEGRDDAARLVSAAKATMSELFPRAAAEGLQLHGGIGMTDEAAPGLYVKRARVTAALLGDAAHHRRRFATEAGWIRANATD